MTDPVVEACLNPCTESDRELLIVLAALGEVDAGLVDAVFGPQADEVARLLRTPVMEQVPRRGSARYRVLPVLADLLSAEADADAAMLRPAHRAAAAYHLQRYDNGVGPPQFGSALHALRHLAACDPERAVDHLVRFAEAALRRGNLEFVFRAVRVLDGRTTHRSAIVDLLQMVAESLLAKNVVSPDGPTPVLNAARKVAVPRERWLIDLGGQVASTFGPDTDTDTDTGSGLKPVVPPDPPPDGPKDAAAASPDETPDEPEPIRLAIPPRRRTSHRRGRPPTQRDHRSRTASVLVAMVLLVAGGWVWNAMRAGTDLPGPGAATHGAAPTPEPASAIGNPTPPVRDCLGQPTRIASATAVAATVWVCETAQPGHRYWLMLAHTPIGAKSPILYVAGKLDSVDVGEYDRVPYVRPTGVPPRAPADACDDKCAGNTLTLYVITASSTETDRLATALATGTQWTGPPALPSTASPPYFLY